MTSKISLTIDLTKINKSRIIERSYQDREGVTVNTKEYKLDIVPKKEPRLIKEGDTWQMVETHFVAEATTKEERDSGYKGAILGSGITFIDKGQGEAPRASQGASEDIDDSIPF